MAITSTVLPVGQVGREEIWESRNANGVRTNRGGGTMGREWQQKSKTLTSVAWTFADPATCDSVGSFLGLSWLACTLADPNLPHI